MTFACRNAKLYGLRDTSGRFLISACEIVRPRSILPGSATGESPDTDTTSATPPTSSDSSTTAVWPAARLMPVRSRVLKPEISAFTA